MLLRAHGARQVLPAHARFFAARRKVVKGEQRKGRRATEWVAVEEEMMSQRPREKAFLEDGLRTQEVLQWHRKEIVDSNEVNDVAVQSSKDRNRWWDNWEAEWDEGWDWEERWQHRRPDGSVAQVEEVILGKDSPRRPRGPMWLQETGYQPVPTLNHQQLTEAIVNARKNAQVDELHWQALCRRAELVAVSMTPAELLAIARCVAERQSGQLRLMWKIASMAVERISSFTSEDLVCFAHVYSSLDSVHHGMLNVVALILASPEDERTMDPILAVDALRSFARAQYPLPLLLQEVRRIILQASGSLKPKDALCALDSFSQLKSLDGELLSVLVPPSLQGSLSETCAAASWARSQLESGGLSLDAPPEMSRAMSDADALRSILSALRESLSNSKWQQLQLRSDRNSEPLCILPHKEGPSAVRGRLLLDAARLLSAGLGEGDLNLAAELLRSVTATRAGQDFIALWPTDALVDWLEVLEKLKPSSVPPELLPSMLGFIVADPTKLIRRPAMIASLADLLPCVLETYGGQETSVSAIFHTGKLLCDILEPELFRLRLQETFRVLDACLQVQALSSGDWTEGFQPHLEALLAAVFEALPAKFKSEAVFHRRSVRSGAEVAAWCQLLASALAHRRPPESLWALLAEESQVVLAAAGLGEDGGVSGALVAKQILEAFLSLRGVYQWDILDTETPLGRLALSVQAQWRHAIAKDGELEDPMHEPAPIPPQDAQSLRNLLQQSGIELPLEVRI